MGANLGLIPARGGSKTVPRKNIRLLQGKPLIAYTIEAALRSKLLDKVVVSTDDEEIREIALQYGAEVPFLRPAEISQDQSGDLPVIRHVLEWYKENYQQQFEKIVYLRPTTPFKTGQLIDRCLEACGKGFFTGFRTVTKVEGVHHPYWMYKAEGGELQTFVEDVDLTKYYRRQLLPDCFRLNGVVDIVLAETLDSDSLYGSRIGFEVLDEKTSVDIDTEFDFRMCEAMMNV
jgi:CMP-N-acetylneuraminic acid synthetase